MLIFRHPVVSSTVERGLTRPAARAQTARAERNALQEELLLWERDKACAPPLPPVQSGHVSSISPY